LPPIDHLLKNFALDETVESLVSTLRDYGSPPWQPTGKLSMERLSSWNKLLAKVTGEDPEDGDYVP
jgi:hypothetical protein